MEHELLLPNRFGLVPNVNTVVRGARVGSDGVDGANSQSYDPHGTSVILCRQPSQPPDRMSTQPGGQTRAALVLTVLICGCDGFYQTVPSGDSAVFVVNRFTGNVTRVRAEDSNPPIVRPLKESKVVVGNHTELQVRAKLYGETVMYSLVALPSASARKDIAAWRSYIQGARSTARIELKFFDGQKFQCSYKPACGSVG
jgi:hypothetical protein